MPFRYYEDFAEGEKINLGDYFVSSEEIIEFAKEFDPAPFHLDAEAGKRSMLGGLAASGWHTCAIGMRMICDSFLLNSSGQGSPGIEKAIWHRPVLAGSTLTGHAEVLWKRVLRSRPGIGIVNFRFSYFIREEDKPAATLENAIMFAARPGTGEPV